MDKKAIVRRITVIEVAILIIVASYSWFADKTNPQISETSIQVTSAEGLYIKLLPDSDLRTSVNLNQIISHFEDFELKQLSSADAQNFYYIDFEQGLSQGDPKFVKVMPESTGLIDYMKHGYIDYDFYLQTDVFGKHVYLHKDTAVAGIASVATRIALNITDGVSSTQYIFGDEEENGITYPFTTKAVIGEGYFDFSNIDPLLTSNQIVNLFAYRNGGRGLSDTAPLDESKLLYSMPPHSQLKVNVKIWLEGGDVDCNNSIASSLLDVNIKFGSADILLPAPSVTANNTTYTIDGLTTAMEYSYTSEVGPWTQVTDPNIVFGTGQTIYVRTAKVIDISPASKETIVIFN